MQMCLHWSVQELKGSSCAHTGRSVCSHIEISRSVWKDELPLNDPTLSSQYFLVLRCSLLVTLTWTLLPKGVHWICYTNGEKTIRVSIAVRTSGLRLGVHTLFDPRISHLVIHPFGEYSSCPNPSFRYHACGITFSFHMLSPIVLCYY